jgi:hypothetical protein
MKIKAAKTDEIRNDVYENNRCLRTIRVEYVVCVTKKPGFSILNLMSHAVITTLKSVNTTVYELTEEGEYNEHHRNYLQEDSTMNRVGHERKKQQPCT